MNITITPATRRPHAALYATLLLFALAGCEKKPAEPFVPDPVIPASGVLPPGHPAINGSRPAAPPAGNTSSGPMQRATVISVINIPQFTYLEVSQNMQTRWLAARTLEAKKGDVVQFDQGSTMTNFNSKALNRTFPSITFVNSATIVQDK